MMLAIALLAALLQNPAAEPRQAQKASISGVVLNAGTGEPMPDVRVVLARTDVNLGLFSQLAAAAGERPPIEIAYSAETLAAMMPAANEDIPEAAAFNAALKSLPLAEIHEVIIGTSGKVAVVSKSSPPGFTDDRGRFSFNDVEPGTYRLIFESPGFSKRDFGQSTVSGEGVPLLLASGQARADLVMRLSAVAAINGRLRDATGQPAAGVPVELFRFEYDENGNRTVRRVARTRTNDRGEYRMYYVSPGRYYLSAGEEGGLVGIGFEGIGAAGAGLDFLMLGRGYVTPNRISQRYTLTYYPGVPDVNAAAPIDLQPGADLQSIDLFVETQKPYRMSGRVVDPRTGQPPPAVDIQWTPDTVDPSFFIAGGLMVTGADYKPTDGTFTIQNVAPGPYLINVTLPNPSPMRSIEQESLSPAERRAQFRAEMELQQAQPRAFAPVNVPNADVEGLVLTLATGYSIPGRFRVEPNASNRSPQWGLLRASLSSPKVTSFNNDLPDPTAPDGIFRTNHVLPGEYRLSVSGVPPGFFIKHARLGNADVLNAPVRVLGQTDTLDILLSPNVGEVKGVAVDAAGQPVQGAQVVLIPQRNRQRTELFRPVTADSSGRFSIPSVEPGDYILAAWDAIEPYAFFDPELIQQAERLGRPIQVTESSSQTANVTSIPLAAR